MAKALEKGKAIISPIVTNSIPITKIPTHEVVVNTIKLNPVK